MNAGKKVAADGAAQKVDTAVRCIEAARKLNDALQAQYPTDSASWRQCDEIDDKLLGALTSLGS